MRLTANKREITGKAARRLRHEGRLPAVVYGHHTAASNIELDAHEFDRIFSRTGKTQLIDLVVDGGTAHKVLVKEVQISPRRNTPLHVDFHQVSLREKLQVEVPVLVSGEAQPVKMGEADVLQVLHTLRVECLPAAIPEAIEVDVSGLDHVDAGIRVSDLTLPDGVTAVVDPEELVVKLAARRVSAAEEEGAAEAAEGAQEGAEAAQEGSEGEAG
ncbi:MAG: 50S ribosomal protein L25 [Candidatus Nephthysia bennettiae]|uniref:Large ribosomal subunit protein bL25 n=1 Tax=Candidatus Nephthysia bennettiae TaxID=3127016 RepID=A0A934KEK4_9BACT|nr:50S ribosomal protein L25 [Candidatus Dormibacteraeota bacterium]MBJ7612270.1 50S ribosomal protein L25 [Candidatus Dormibacteraeota bacterium]PZR87990.1 MAG: 50S ribosomal protein L25 [Candidatus Dormibacteraeota bacterium]